MSPMVGDLSQGPPAFHDRVTASFCWMSRTMGIRKPATVSIASRSDGFACSPLLCRNAFHWVCLDESS